MKKHAIPYLQRRKMRNDAMIIPINLANFEATVRKFYIDQEKHVGVTLGPGSYLVNGRLAFGSKDCHVLIGRYCSLGHRLTFMIGMNPDYHQVTTYPFGGLASKGEGELNHSADANHNQIIIGNDVWIGCDVTIMAGVRIGNGAVIDAGTVITKDIPPYAVVAGNPGNVIEYRFDTETTGKLQQIKWWNWPESKILDGLKLMNSPSKFIEKYYQTSDVIRTDVWDKLSGLQRDGWTIIGLIGDFQAEHPLWKTVIHQYLNAFAAKDKVIFRLEIVSSMDASQELQEIEENLQQRGESAPAIMTHIYEEGIVPADVISCLNYLITNREDSTSQYLDYIGDHEVDVLCGFDDWIKNVNEIKSKKYEITVCVCTYCSDYHKLFVTLESAIRQQGCSFEIVVSDDGTPNFERGLIEEWFHKHNFWDYHIVVNLRNQGTVKNFYAAVSVAQGEYIKGISPGDYFYDDHVLSKARIFMQENQYKVVFGRGCYYSKENGIYKVLDRMNPMDLQPYIKKDYQEIAKNYLLHQDYIIGAALFFEMDTVKKYLALIIDRVIYTEDAMAVIMISDGMKIGFWNHNMIWYEYGTGISTNITAEGAKRLGFDNGAVEKIISERHPELANIAKFHTPDNYRLYCRKMAVRKKERHESYLENVDINELEKLVHDRVVIGLL